MHLKKKRKHDQDKKGEKKATKQNRSSQSGENFNSQE